MTEWGRQHYLKKELYRQISIDSQVFEFLQSGSLDGIWYLDLEQPSEEWMSPRYKEVFGYEDHEVPNSALWWQENIFPEDRELVYENIRKHLEDPTFPFDQIVRYKHKNGSTVWVRCRGMIIRDDTNKPVRMLGAHTDVTAIKRAEERLRALCEASADMYFVADLDSGVVSECSQQLRENMGLTTAVEGRSLCELSHAQSLTAMRAALEALHSTKEVRNLELSLQRADGSRFPVLLSAGTAPSPDGERKLVRGWFRDIRHLKVFANMEVLLAALPSGILLTDGNNLIRASNPAADELLGYSKNELAGRPVPDLLPGVLSLDSVSGPLDVLGIRKDGQSIPLRVGLSRITLEEGKFSVIAMTDLTASRAMESALSESEFRFRQLTESLPQLVWTCTPDGQRDYISPQWVKYTGMDEATALSGAWVTAIHPDDLAEVRERWWASVRGGEEFRTEYRLRNAAGGYRWFEGRAVALKNSENQIIKWFGISTDIHAARHTREALERERSLLTNLVSLAPAVFCSFALSGEGRPSFPYAGEDFADLLGVRAGHLDEDMARLISHLHWEDRGRLGADIRKSAEHLEPFRTDFRVPHPIRGERWVAANFNPSRNLDGSTVWHGFLNDVTDRKQAEEDQQFLLDLGAELQAEVSCHAIARVATEKVARYLGVNRSSLYSINPARMEATPIYQFTGSGVGVPLLAGTKPIGEWARPELVTTLASGVVLAIENTAVHPFTAEKHDAAYKKIGVESLVLVPLRRSGELVSVLSLADGKPRAWPKREVALVRHVAERVWPAYEAARAMEAERAMHVTLAASEERLRLALNCGAIGIWENNPATGERRWDERSKRIFGFPPDQAVDTEAVLKCILPEDQERVQQQVLEYYDPAGSGHFESAYRIIRNGDASLRHIYGQGQMFFEGEGEARRPVRSIGTMQDVTVLKEGEQALQRANEELEQFAYAAAHDMQEPLRNVGLAAQILASRYEGQLDSQADLLLNIAVEGSRRMQDMVKDLLAYSRVLVSDEDAVWRADASESCALVVSNLETAIRETGAQITWDHLPCVRMRPVHLNQVLQNLITNSLKYSGGKQPVIHVSSQRRHGDYVLSVKDNGVGIPAEFRERAFGVFKRLHGREVPGTGIGLSLCKRIVEHYGGRIWIESAGEEGTAVLFSVIGA